MKRISLYIEHGVGNGVGGAELMMARLAAAWSHAHDVELVHHRPPLTRERLAEFSTEDLSRVAIRCVPRSPEEVPPRSPSARLAAARNWHRSLSEGRDLFVACTHWVPPFCHARQGVLLVLFPFYVRPQDAREMRMLPWWKRLRHQAYHDVEWHLRLRSYRTRLSISEFTRDWTQRRWRIESQVLPPPVDTGFARRDKQPLILSVGRFSTMAHTKKQLEMAQTFRRLVDEGLDGWQYLCLGGLNSRDENRAYFEQVRATLAGYPAVVEANVAPAVLRERFAEASLFWHATGLGDDTNAHPELAEHFGIAPVEAMAAGCVPLVVNKGGPAEIVADTSVGVRWDTLAELAAATRRLIGDPALRQRMADAARQRADRYSAERFIENMSRACDVAYAPPAARAMTSAPAPIATRVAL